MGVNAIQRDNKASNYGWACSIGWHLITFTIYAFTETETELIRQFLRLENVLQPIVCPAIRCVGRMRLNGAIERCHWMHSLYTDVSSASMRQTTVKIAWHKSWNQTQFQWNQLKSFIKMQTTLLGFALRSLPLRFPYNKQTLKTTCICQNRLYSNVANGQNEKESTAISSKTESGVSDIAATPDDSNAARKLIKVAVIGVPNAGKSSFINQIMDRRVSVNNLYKRITRELTCPIRFRFAQHRERSTPHELSRKRFSTERSPKWFCSTHPAWSPGKKWKNTSWAALSSALVVTRSSMRTSSLSSKMYPIRTHETHCIRRCSTPCKSTITCPAFWCSIKSICWNRSAFCSIWWTFWPKRLWCIATDVSYHGQVPNASSSKTWNGRSNIKMKSPPDGQDSPRCLWCHHWLAMACIMCG